MMMKSEFVKSNVKLTATLTESCETKPSCSSSITNSTNNVKNSELDENHPTLDKQDMRRFSSLKYEQSFPWLYNSCIKSGYLCKYCELFQKEVFQSVHTDQALLQTFPNVYKPEKLGTLGTHGTGRRQTMQKTQHRKLKK